LIITAILLSKKKMISKTTLSLALLALASNFVSAGILPRRQTDSTDGNAAAAQGNAVAVPEGFKDDGYEPDSADTYFKTLEEAKKAFEADDSD
jgi:hypothetical protein